MIIKISYPFKDTFATLQYKNIYIQTEDNDLIEEITSLKNPIDIGVILSENEKKFKIVKETKADKEIILNDVIANPDLRLNLFEDQL